MPLRSEEKEELSVLLPKVSQYASHLHCTTPPICIAVLLFFALESISWPVFTPPFFLSLPCRGNEGIYLYCSGLLLENGLDRPENRYGRYGFASLPGFPYLP